MMRSRIREIARAWPVVVALALLPGCGGGGGGGGSHGGTADEGIEVTVPGRFPDTGSRSSGSIVFDVTPSSDDAADDVLIDITRPHQFANRASLLKNGEFLRFVITTDTGRETSISVRIGSWSADMRHTVAATWGDGCARLYLDGERLADSTYTGELLLVRGTPIVGDYGNFPPSATSVERVTVYGRPLAPEDVLDDFATHAGNVVLGTTTNVSGDGKLGQVCITLHGGGHQVVGTQNDLVWDRGCAELLEDTCQIDPLTGKTLFANLFDDAQLRALVLDFFNTAPIDDGPLYCCTFALQSEEPGRCCSFQITNTGASDPLGLELPSQAVGGRLCPTDAPATCHP